MKRSRPAATGLAAVLTLFSLAGAGAAQAAWEHNVAVDQPLLIAVLIGLCIASVGLGVLHLRLRATAGRTEKAERIFHALLENTSDGIILYDENDRVLMHNAHPSFSQLPGRDYAAAPKAGGDGPFPFSVGATFDEVVDSIVGQGLLVSPDPGTWRRRRQEILQDGKGTLEFQFTDGRWLLISYRKLPGVGTVAILHDITAIKERERTLTTSAARYRDLVERSPVAIYVHRDRKVLYANPAAARLLGYASPADLVGRDIFELVHPDHHKLGLKRLDMIQNDADDALPQVDMKFMRADGQTLHTEAQVSRVLFDGAPALESILYDISARRRTERALMESEQRYRNLFELAPDAIVVHDGQAILFANDAAARMFGAASDVSLFGRAIRDFAPAEGGTCPLLSQDTDDPLRRVHACVLKRGGGETFDAEVVAATTNYHGHQVFQAIIRDVTERKRMDSTMAQNAKLASLGGIAAGLAHELSQPLNILRFAADGGLLKMSKGKADDALHERNYRLIQNQAERMGSIMDNMRIFSRKNPGPMRPFDAALTVRNIAHLVRNPFRIEDVHIELRGAVSGVQTHGNPIQLEQVLLNLLNNARDSILAERARADLDAPGRIIVECASNAGLGDAVITVTDNGGGIPPEHLGRIFDPFFTTKDEGHGTGLGLALSHELITGMSGTISGFNTGEGARFTVRLPLVEGRPAGAAPANDDHAAPARPRPTQRAGAVRHILVVEDEVEAARAMADFLSEEGYRVSLAHTGNDGLDAYHSLRPDMVITDIRMPGLDGAALITALRQEQADLPIIAVTGHMGETEKLDAGADLPPVKVLRKPVSLRELSREIGLITAA